MCSFMCYQYEVHPASESCSSIMATKGRRNTSQVETDETKAELDRKQTLLNLLTRKLNYFNKTSEGIISAGKMDKMQRQYSHLKTKLEEVYDP